MWYLIIATLFLSMDDAFPFPHLPMTSLYLRCTNLFSKRSRIYATVKVSNGGMISISLKVALQHLARLNHSILSPWRTMNVFCVTISWKSFTNIRVSVSLRITSAHFPQILTTISIRQEKSWFDILPI